MNEPLPDALDMNLFGADLPETTEQREMWSIQSADAAEWAMRKIAALTDQMESLQALAKRETERINLWLEHATAPILNDVGYFSAQLERFHLAFLKEQDDRGIEWAKVKKSQSLPSGELTAAKGTSSWTAVDAEAFIAWARANAPELIRQKPAPPPEPDIAEAKKVLVEALSVTQVPDGDGQPQQLEAPVIITQDGELVPGLTYERKPLRIGIAPDMTPFRLRRMPAS